MKETSRQLQNWVINKIKTDYAEDIDLLLAVKGHSVNGDDHGEVFDFYIPATERANELAETFIIDGIGHDLYPRSWERMVHTADFEDGQSFCIGNSEILYARNAEVKTRYEQILNRFFNNLNNPEFTRFHALELLDQAMNLYKTLVFEEKPYMITLGAGLIMHQLNLAVCYLNGTYLSQLNPLDQLKALNKLPDGFIEDQEAALQTNNPEALKQFAYRLIKSTRVFLTESSAEPVEKSDVNYQALADWYQELSLCWKRIYYFCSIGDYQNAYSDAVYLQSELIVIRTEFALKEMDLLGVYDHQNLTNLVTRAKELENYILDLLKEKNIKLNQYDSLSEFLEAHN